MTHKNFALVLTVDIKGDLRGERSQAGSVGGLTSIDSVIVHPPDWERVLVQWPGVHRVSGVRYVNLFTVPVPLHLR